MKENISKDEQVRALATRQIYDLMKKYGLPTLDPRSYLTITRQDVLHFFQGHRKLAADLLTDPKKRPFHDVLCMEQLGNAFVVFDMDHGIPRDEMFYDTIEEAATDLVAFYIGYGYPEGYGFRKQ